MLKVAMAQMNVTLGDLAANVDKIVACAEDARAAGADVLVTPELALCGYPPEDLLLRPDFYVACAEALAQLSSRVSGIAVLVGHPQRVGGRRYNAATLIVDGEQKACYHKRSLPDYEVFEETRYFARGDAPCVVEIAGVHCGICICEDVWQEGAVEATLAAGATVLLVLNASPFHLDKHLDRVAVLRQRITHTGLAVVYVNLVGGQDELVFDGGSFVLNRLGELVVRLPQFVEVTACVEFFDGQPRSPEAKSLTPPLSLEAQVYGALVLGVRDYVVKNGFPSVLIGLSGGIDSALTLVVAVEALGAERVRAVMMPSPYTAQMSLDDSRQLVDTLGVRYDEIPITSAMRVYAELLQDEFLGLPADTTEENLQARIRGNILMALSNKSGALVLTTGNKSEMAVGYCTLYGDMAGGFAVLKDVFKTMVYRLSCWLNRDRELISERIISRPPSAELRPEQTDQDSLPPYAVLDAIIEAYMQGDESPREIIAAGYAESDVRKVVRLLHLAEYKRRQAPIGVRVTRRGFGKDWRYPVTNRYAGVF